MYDLDLFHGINVGYVGKGFPVPLGPIRDIYIYNIYMHMDIFVLLLTR